MTKMKTFILLSLAIIFLSGCCQNPSVGENRDTVVRINNYSISRAEFEREFKDSVFGKTDTPESRKDFLNNLIDRKLILQYAQAEGLDKESSFLRMIEKFWEQSLLKSALDKKTNEIEAMIKTQNWQVKREEESEMISAWLKGLRTRANIKIKEDILKSKAF